MEKMNDLYSKIQILNGSWLKLLAVVTMTIDHIGALILPQLDFGELTINILGKSFTTVFIFRCIGRLAFPIFAFLITQGFIYTSDRKKYGANLLLFAIISEIPYNLFKTGTPWYLARQNIYFTLFLGFLALYIIDSVPDNFKKAVLVGCLVVFSILLKGDYGAKGLILIILLYFFREQRLLGSVLSYGFLSGGVFAWCAFVPINMYNGKRGFINGKILKYVFYSFYPVHLLVLVVVRTYLL